MKIRSNLHAGAELCPQANLWRKRAEAAADTLQKCKKRQNYDLYPLYYEPASINPGVVIPVQPVVVGSYDGRDYSGLCG